MKKNINLQTYINEYEESLYKNMGTRVAQTQVKIDKCDANFQTKKKEKELKDTSNNQLAQEDCQNNEKNKDLFNYDFEIMSNFEHYFNMGNYKNRQEKYMRLRVDNLCGQSQPSSPSIRRKGIASFK